MYDSGRNEVRRLAPILAVLLGILGALAAVVNLGQNVHPLDIAIGAGANAGLGYLIGWGIDRFRVSRRNSRTVGKEDTPSPMEPAPPSVPLIPQTAASEPDASPPPTPASSSSRRADWRSPEHSSQPSSAVAGYAVAAPAASEVPTSRERTLGNKRSGRTWGRVALIVAVIALMLGAVDIFLRNRSADEVMSKAERGEAVLEGWRDEIEALLVRETGTSTPTPADQQRVARTLQQMTSEALADLRRARVGLVAADVLLWHGSIGTARNDWLAHFDAWSDRFGEIGRAATPIAVFEAMLGGDALTTRISDTFRRACDTTARMVPLLDIYDVEQRAAEACAD